MQNLTRDERIRKINTRFQIHKNLTEYQNKINIPLRFHNSRFNDMQINKDNSAMINFMKNLKYECDSVLLIGGAGSGKTYASCAFARKYLWRGKKVKFVSAPKLLIDIRSTFGSESGLSEDGLIKKYIDYETLIIDDIGADRVSEYTKQVWYIIIDGRYSAMKNTIYTSNLSIQEISNSFGDRIASRMASGKVINIRGSKDYRI